MESLPLKSISEIVELFRSGKEYEAALTFNVALESKNRRDELLEKAFDDTIEFMKLMVGCIHEEVLEIFLQCVTLLAQDNLERNYDFLEKLDILKHLENIVSGFNDSKLLVCDVCNVLYWLYKFPGFRDKIITNKYITKELEELSNTPGLTPIIVKALVNVRMIYDQRYREKMESEIPFDPEKFLNPEAILATSLHQHASALLGSLISSPDAFKSQIDSTSGRLQLSVGLTSRSLLYSEEESSDSEDYVGDRVPLQGDVKKGNEENIEQRENVNEYGSITDRLLGRLDNGDNQDVDGNKKQGASNGIGGTNVGGVEIFQDVSPSGPFDPSGELKQEDLVVEE